MTDLTIIRTAFPGDLEAQAYAVAGGLWREDFPELPFGMASDRVQAPYLARAAHILFGSTLANSGQTAGDPDHADTNTPAANAATANNAVNNRFGLGLGS